MYAKAGELGLPVGYMPFKGLLRHIDEIETLAKDYPSTKVMLDHFGFCKFSDMGSEEWQRLLALAELPQVRIQSVLSILLPVWITCAAVRNSKQLCHCCESRDSPFTFQVHAEVLISVGSKDYMGEMWPVVLPQQCTC